jgi:hypothetical protein
LEVASVADVIIGLKAVLAQIATARRHLASCGWTDADADYRAVTTGSARPEIADLTRLGSQAAHRIAESDQLAARAETAINAVITTVQGEPTAASISLTEPAATNQHGDRYPADFGTDTARSMPPRVRRGARNAEMMGYATVDGRDLGKLGASRSDPWAEQVQARLRELGLYQYLWLSHHVEMKTVALLLSAAGSHAEARINHAPCGSEPRQGSGCHQVLPDFIPKGRSLTVMGTDSHGAPFRHTYQGRAPR